jgi:glycerophosphoryl diester phosphodiesterase
MGFKRCSFIVLLMLVSCKKKSYPDVSVVGHGCMGLEILNSVYHDNTEEAFDLATGMAGLDGVEIDVQLSLDGSIWLFHDDEISLETNGSGCLGTKSDQEIKTLSYKSLYKENLVKLSELDLTRIKEKKLFIDLRHYNKCEGAFYDPVEWIAAINSIEFPADIELYIVLSIPEWSQDFIDQGYKVLLSAFEEEELSDLLSQGFMADGFMVKNAIINETDVQAIRALGKKVFIFEMRAPKSIRKALQKGPDGVVSDDLRAALIERN